MKKFSIALAAASVCMPAAVFAQDGYETEAEEEYVSPASSKEGLRVEARVFYENISDPADVDCDILYCYETGYTYEFGNGFGVGAEVGYDVAVGDTVVVGPYFTYDFSSLETCEIDACFAAPEYWAAGLHVGITSGGSGQLYGKIGYGQQTVTLKGVIDDPDFGLITLDERETKGGYNFAFGYEHAFGETMYVRGELGVSESYDVYGFDLQRGLFAVALGARF